jgi:GLPGLI family protein
MDKKFLIKDTQDGIAWKMTGESQMLLDRMCLKATHEDSSKHVVAWFTTEILIPSGPEVYGQLPGMILQLDINNGERVITARSIDFKDLDEEAIKKPTKGKEVTQEEFRAIVKAKMEEMRGSHQGGNRIIIHH